MIEQSHKTQTKKLMVNIKNGISNEVEKILADPYYVCKDIEEMERVEQKWRSKEKNKSMNAYQSKRLVE